MSIDFLKKVKKIGRMLSALSREALFKELNVFKLLNIKL